ncbi:Peptidoglycan O-acetyltransferase [Candidatus Magnetaquicoccaceae bacterium FCR-1]|uniref:Probable alginate O-acetylase AlgI n=1 Tax=Candidatus Magnetaquiglobus chichijimensis TaxID=3141448 RepID=A0ABQ0CD14_9PROT
MLFQSIGFLFVLLPLFLVSLRLAPPGTARGLVIFFFSYLFYSGNEPFFLVLLLLSSTLDFFTALRIDRAVTPWGRRGWLIVTLCLNLGLLGFFKYGKMLLPKLAPLGDWLGLPMPDPELLRSLVLPPGISFYTFQSMAYSIDVYRGHVRPERNYLSFLNYLAYLPQLIAGPIERYAHLSAQLHALVEGKTRPNWSAGLDRIALGVIQKLLIADHCGLIVNAIADQGRFDSLVSSWTFAFGFGLQIYFDFAAYTHIAIGLGLLMGVELAENFLSPYQAPNIQEFWRRWHLSLSTWFKDYLYFPLGGSRKGRIRTVFNLLVTFLLCGLWHGAGWNFIVWGGLHGALVGGYTLMRGTRLVTRMPRVVAIALTLVVVHVCWVWFRLHDPEKILVVLKGMIGGHGLDNGAVSPIDGGFLVLVMAGTLLLPNAAQRWPGSAGWWESTLLLGVALAALLNIPQIAQFIYFQF